MNKSIGQALTRAASRSGGGTLTRSVLGCVAPAAQPSLTGILVRGAIGRAAFRRSSPNLLGQLFKGVIDSVHWPTFAAGAVSAVVAPSVAKPLLTPVLKAGMSVPLMVNDAWVEAKTEADAVRAASVPAGDVLSEVQQLRAEIASLKASLAASKSE